MKRIELTGVQKDPNFIGSWFIEPVGLCDDFIEFFETNEDLQFSRQSMAGVDEEHKKSTDLTIFPRNLDEPNYAPVRKYIDCLYDCYTDYVATWPYLEGFPKLDIGVFNLQRYQEGGHFKKLHTERSSLSSLHRLFAWMTYLNDVPVGGETHFANFDLDVQPEKGKTLIWPAEWTHAHKGNPVTQGTKYIITGWMHFPA